MMRHALTCLALFTLLTPALGCTDDGPSDDDIGSDADDSTGESTGESTEGESGSTSESTDDPDSSSTDAETTDAETTDAETTDAETTDAETTDAETSDAETSDTETDTGEPIMCPDVFPEFDKSCSEAADCAVVVHTTDCCGNSVAWGINAAEVDAFDAAEAICDSQYPECDCPSGPTVAEDGKDAWEPAEFAVDCLMGSCTSYVPG